MCNFRPFNAHIQIFSYVFLNFSQQILTFTKIHTGNRRAVRLTPGCPVITMRSPYLIRYEVLNVITMRIPYLIRYEVLCHCERSVAISRKGNLVIKPTQDTLRQFKRELIKISIQFVCKHQSIFFYIPKSTALYFHIICTCIYIY